MLFVLMDNLLSAQTYYLTEVPKKKKKNLMFVG